MKRLSGVMVVLMVLALVLGAFTAAQPAAAQGDEKIVIYMQMGGTQGDGTTLARTNGAKAAAEAPGHRAARAVLELGSAGDDQPVQGGAGCGTGRHRDHGTPRRRRIHGLGG